MREGLSPFYAFGPWAEKSQVTHPRSHAINPTSVSHKVVSFRIEVTKKFIFKHYTNFFRSCLGNLLSPIAPQLGDVTEIAGAIKVSVLACGCLC